MIALTLYLFFGVAWAAVSSTEEALEIVAEERGRAEMTMFVIGVAIGLLFWPLGVLSTLWVAVSEELL